MEWGGRWGRGAGVRGGLWLQDLGCGGGGVCELRQHTSMAAKTQGQGCQTLGIIWLFPAASGLGRWPHFHVGYPEFSPGGRHCFLPLPTAGWSRTSPCV